MQEAVETTHSLFVMQEGRKHQLSGSPLKLKLSSWEAPHQLRRHRGVTPLLCCKLFVAIFCSMFLQVGAIWWPEVIRVGEASNPGPGTDVAGFDNPLCEDTCWLLCEDGFCGDDACGDDSAYNVDGGCGEETYGVDHGHSVVYNLSSAGSARGRSAVVQAPFLASDSFGGAMRGYV